MTSINCSQETTEIMSRFNRVGETVQKRFGLNFRRLHGKDLGANQGAITREILHPTLIIRICAARDIRNPDEFELFYCQPPTWTMSNWPVSGFKQKKTCKKSIACCKSDGSERMSVMIVGQAWKPHLFNGKSGAELGLKYYANKKSWMAKALLLFTRSARLLDQSYEETQDSALCGKLHCTR